MNEQEYKKWAIDQEIVVFVINKEDAIEIREASKNSGYGDIIDRILILPDETMRYFKEVGIDIHIKNQHTSKDMWFGIHEAKINLGLD